MGIEGLDSDSHASGPFTTVEEFFDACNSVLKRPIPKGSAAKQMVKNFFEAAAKERPLTDVANLGKSAPEMLADYLADSSHLAGPPASN